MASLTITWQSLYALRPITYYVAINLPFTRCRIELTLRLCTLWDCGRSQGLSVSPLLLCRPQDCRAETTGVRRCVAPKG